MEEEERDYVICAKVRDVPEPVPGSTTVYCSMCEEPLWLAPSAQSFVEGNEDIGLLCMDCAIEEAIVHEEQRVAPIPGSADERTFPQEVVQEAFRRLVEIKRRQRS